jgi:hypothetical protein
MLQRSIIAALILVASATMAQAQMPRTISYQGVLADNLGNFVPDGSYTLLVSLHDALTGGSKLFTETHQATVVRGVFNVIIGSVTSLPASIRFDRAYFLEVSVNGNSLSPRTALTAVPYAMRASAADLAEGLTPTATGAVRSINGGSGNLTLTGAGGTTITRTGETITITSTGSGGTGIQGVQNSDGSLAITTPNGPVAGLSVAPNGISTAKIADLAVTAAKLDKNAVTSDKIVDGSIGGDDISSTAALNIVKLTTSGTASIGTQLSTARLTVQGTGTTSPGAALNVTNSAGASILYARNDGNVGIGTTTPFTSLEVAGGFYVSGGITVLSSGSLPAGPGIIIPPNRSVVQITDDGALAPNLVMLPPGGLFGQILYITNDDAQATGGGAVIAPGQTRAYVFVGGAWRLVN